jgi:hypothetical protein
MTFALYLIGYLIFTGGVAWALSTAGVSQQWVLIVAVILVGLGIVTGAKSTRSKDPS